MMMTKECPHVILKRKNVGLQRYYQCECGQKFRCHEWDGKLEAVFSQVPQDKDGWTKDGQIAGDYAKVGRDPNLPRTAPQNIEEAIAKAVEPTGGRGQGLMRPVDNISVEHCSFANMLKSECDACRTARHKGSGGGKMSIDYRKPNWLQDADEQAGIDQPPSPSLLDECLRLLAKYVGPGNSPEVDKVFDRAYNINKRKNHAKSTPPDKRRKH